MKKFAAINQKNIAKLILLPLLVFTLSNCRSRDDTPEVKTYPDENPLDSYVAQSGFSANGNFVNSGNYEFGLAFSPNVNGKIKALIVKIPDANADLKVTVWDYAAKTVIRTEVVNVTAANTITTKSISDINLEKDKKYLITMNGNDWYNRTKPDNTNTTYPITAGNIKFFEYRWESATAVTFPTNLSNSYYAGDVNFVFQQTD